MPPHTLLHVAPFRASPHQLIFVGSVAPQFARSLGFQMSGGRGSIDLEPNKGEPFSGVTDKIQALMEKLEEERKYNERDEEWQEKGMGDETDPNWDHERHERGLKVDAFVRGEKAEAEALFCNEGKPVHCLSTRFEGSNFRASMLIGHATMSSAKYIAIYNPNWYNQFTAPLEEMGVLESKDARKSRTNGRWLLAFIKALEHTKRTEGCLLQLLQTDHVHGPYSDMQTSEKRMAEVMGIKVLAFEFKGDEVSVMKPPFPTGNFEFKENNRDETAFKQNLERFLSDNDLFGACEIDGLKQALEILQQHGTADHM